MNGAVVTFRFLFTDGADSEDGVSIHWCLTEPGAECGDLSMICQLPHDKDGSFRVDHTVTVDKPQMFFFRFDYPGCDKTRIGSYLIAKSLRLPVVITEINRLGDVDVTLRFKISYHTYFGQILAVVGSLPELGCWDVKKALKLQHSGWHKRSPNDDGIFTDHRYNWQGDIKLPRLPGTISYMYFVMNEAADPQMEPGTQRMLEFQDAAVKRTLFEFNDVWRWNEMAQSVFAKRLFDVTLFMDEKGEKVPTIDSSSVVEEGNRDLVRCVFCAHCGVVGKARSLSVVGSIPELGQWNPGKGLRLEPGPHLQWLVNVLVPRSRFPFEFKLVAVGGADSIVWETHENRWATVSDTPTQEVAVLDCWHARFANLSFHGAGIIIDVNALDEFDFGDLENIVNWSKEVGFAAIHLAGLLDTTGMSQKFESLPVSACAINPLFAELPGGKIRGKSRADILEAKLKRFRSMWETRRDTFKSSVSAFREDNTGFWLSDYEKLCYGRSKGEDYAEVVDQKFADFVDFVQCFCYRQLESVIVKASDANIAVGMDVPFPLSERSAEAFAQPELFLRDYSLGVQPSPDQPIGTVLEAYPYNFSVAQEWFKQRISTFAKKFSIIRFESTIKYFRQWIVPRATSVRAVFGHYEPSVNVSYSELETWGLWDIERYTQPYLSVQSIQKLFREDARKVEDAFMVYGKDHTLSFKPEFSTERALVTAELPPEQAALREKYMDDLLRLLGEVILIKAGENEYRPRPVFPLAATSKSGEERSFSFSALPSYQQSPFVRLEEEFVNNKQRTLWTSNGRRILQAITAISDTTFLSDAAGTNGELCDEALQSVGVMPLRVQLEGRTRRACFDDIRGYPYLSVASPQRQLDVPMRVIWEEDRNGAKKLWAEEFWEMGVAPPSYTDDVAVNIMKQHCWSGSMWVLFPVDCLVGAGKYITESEHVLFGTLDLKAFCQDEKVSTIIKAVLEQTKRK